MKTFVGIELLEAFKALDAQLESNAYKPVTGGKGEVLGLTDIRPAYLPAELNRLFGPIGLGWSFAIHDMKTDERSDGSFACSCMVSGWYRAVDGEKSEIISLPAVPGSSINKPKEWAEKGAVTNALGTLWFFAGWQISVYMGKRGHNQQDGAERPRPPQTAARPPVQSLAAMKVEAEAYKLELHKLTGTDFLFLKVLSNYKFSSISEFGIKGMPRDCIEGLRKFVANIKDKMKAANLNTLVGNADILKQLELLAELA